MWGCMSGLLLLLRTTRKARKMKKEDSVWRHRRVTQAGSTRGAKIPETRETLDAESLSPTRNVLNHKWCATGKLKSLVKWCQEVGIWAKFWWSHWAGKKKSGVLKIKASQNLRCQDPRKKGSSEKWTQQPELLFLLTRRPDFFFSP